MDATSSTWRDRPLRLSNRSRRQQLRDDVRQEHEPEPPSECGSPAYIRAAIDRSLENLQVDHVDLWLYHSPDGTTPIAETLGALDGVVKAGKVRYVGCSNFSAAQLAEADATARTARTVRFAAVQNRYNLLERQAEADVMPLAHDLGIAFVSYYPLANGLLTGKYARGEVAPKGSRMATNPSRWADLLSEESFDRVDALRAFAKSHGCTLLELALAGVASRPDVAGVVVGATTPEQVRTNAAVAESTLDAATLTELFES